MLTTSELKSRAWNSLKKSYWWAFLATMTIYAIIESASFIVSAPILLISPIFSVLMEYAFSVESILIILFFFYVTILIFAFAGSLLITLITAPLYVGQSKFFIVNTDEKPNFTDIFAFFKDGYFNIVKTHFFVVLKTYLWSLLFLIPGYIKYYEYSMIPYILAENPRTSTKEAFRLSKIMMNGNKWRLFMLDLSFIGWVLLSLLTCGIGVFFLVPYQQAAYAEFYEAVKKEREFMLK